MQKIPRNAKRPNEGFFNTPETPKRHQLQHFIGTVIIWGLQGVEKALSRPFDKVISLKYRVSHKNWCIDIQMIFSLI